MKNINHMIKQGKKKQTGNMMDFLRDIKKTEPYQIVYEIERLHEDGKRLDLAL